MRHYHKEAEITIDRLVIGGKGLAGLEGHDVLVSGVLPHEKVLVSLGKRRRRVYDARLIRVIEPSPERIAPPCRGEEESTGAGWSFIPYETQLRLKEGMLKDLFRETLDIGTEKFLPIIPSPDTDHYRLRVQINVRYDGTRPMFGFFREGTQQMVEVTNCIHLHPVINNVIDALRKVSNLFPRMKEIHVNASPKGEVLVIFYVEQDYPETLAPLFDALRKEMPGIVGVIGYEVREKREVLGRNFLDLPIDGLTLRSTEGNFFQVNWRQNERMLETVLDMAGLKGDEDVMDLCCGIGNFTLPLARKTRKVIGIECVQSSIDDAVYNAQANGISNAEFICDTARRGLKQLVEHRRARADLVLMDPPRAGMVRRALERVIELSPKKVIYVSCNPSTLVNDLRILMEGGFYIKTVRPLDMFPLTPHVETMVEMVRE